jgi:Tfp pilus assembly protein FimT
MLEILVVIAIIGIVAAFALPGAINFVKAYRLHADASAIASQLNVARFRATSQYTPYRLSFDTSNGLFSAERMSSDYSSSTTEISLGLQPGIRMLSGCPVSAKPGTIASSFSGISGSIYFNTRGLPVDSAGTPTNSNVIYLANDNDLYDAVTVSLGGRITVWNYSTTASAWVAR